MSEINELFNVQNYNLIQDENYYYFIRALNNGDHNDMQTGITRNANEELERVRTDRARYIENPENGTPIYSEDEPVSIRQVIDHIKKGHRYDTNCISLSSNCNVSVIYGNGYYHDEYVIIRVPKEKVGEKVINAIEYILSEIDKRIQEALESTDDVVKELIEKIDSATTREELLEIIADSYKEPNTDEAKYTANEGMWRRKTPSRGRYSDYATLSGEQNLLKNKIVAKLTVLEERKIMKQIMPHTVFDSKVIETLGMAISSSELIHYGEIDALDDNGQAQMFEVSKEVIRILGLLQQAVERNQNLAEKVHQMENEIIKQTIEGKKIDESLMELLQSRSIESDLPSISIKQAFEITNGKLQYEDALETLEKIYYLSKSVRNARNYSSVIDALTGNNSENAEVIETIYNFGLDVEPKLMNRKGKSIYKISESVGIPLMSHETGLIEVIQNMSIDEIEAIIKSADNSKSAINSLTNFQDEPQIPIDEYYARAMFEKYDWNAERIHFSQAHKESFIKKLQERPVAQIYETLNKAGVADNIISKVIINLMTIDREDTNKILDEIEQGNITNELLNQLQSNESEFRQPLQVEQLEDYLDFYRVEGTDIKLRDYQQSAIDNVHKIFETHRFASVILPTGAGKSFVAIAELLRMQEQFGKESNEKILYLAPSNEILDQIKKYTEKYVHGEKINKSRDEIFKEIFPNIELATYSSLLQKEDEELKSQKYKYIVLDELHRTGAEKWGEKLNVILDAQDESTKVLGITATPQRDVDGRNMADEIAKRLGFSEQEIRNRKHIAKKMDLIDAIRLGIVVNPKIVECEYNLKNDTEAWESLLAKINKMDDGPEKDEYLRKFDELRRKINKAQEIPELLRDNIVKKDGRYIFYMPIGANEYEEDENGNIIGKKSGAAKVKQAEEQLREWLKYVDDEPEFYSMLGEYGDRKNAQQLEQFEKSISGHTKVMIVMNKLNEGVHVSGINGIIWQRALYEDSRILLFQEFGRAIYSTKEGEQVSEEDRPVVIDLANNLTRVDLDKTINTYDEIDDLNLLQNVIDWVEEHDGCLPDINAAFREEARLASTLKRIQNKYIKYTNDEEFGKLNEEKAEKVDAILELGSEIDLWNLKLPEQDKTSDLVRRSGNTDNNDIHNFALRGILKEFVDFVKSTNRTPFEEVMQWAEEHGRMPKRIKKAMFDEEKAEKCLYSKWVKSQERKIVVQYIGKKIEEIPEEYRELVREIRELGYGLGSGLTPFEEVMQWAKEHGRLPKQNKKNVKKRSAEEVIETRLYDKWYNSSEKKIVDQYIGKKIEEIPEEYRELVREIRELGYGLGSGLTSFEEVMKWAKEHGRLPKHSKNDTKERSDEEKTEMSLYYKWLRSQEKKIVDQYIGKKIEEIPEEDRDLVRMIRELGYKPGVKTQNIGKATFDANTQICEEASTIISGLVEEKQQLFK